ncbi:hypothetical protein IWZ00DRAFT_81757 [Phyllosticta capitalensis]
MPSSQSPQLLFSLDSTFLLYILPPPILTPHLPTSSPIFFFFFLFLFTPSTARPSTIHTACMHRPAGRVRVSLLHMRACMHARLEMRRNERLFVDLRQSRRRGVSVLGCWAVEWMKWSA